MEPSLDESTIGKPSNTDYANWILPFFVNEHTELAPFNRFHSTATTRIDDWLSMNQQVASTNSRSLFRSHRRVRNINPIKQILEQMSSSVDGPIDLTESTDPLAKVPYKFLFFQQDIRPPYKGTYTRPVSPRSTRKLARNPCHRGLPDTNYDYDSEAEWQEPEEGDDDLMDEDEKSEDEDADEEMDDFLDDEGTVVKRQLLVSDMEPKSSGLCWAGSEISPQGGFDLSIYRMDVLHDSTTFPIDPYSTKHWSDTGKSSPNKRDKTQASASHPAMQPPRLPLAAVDGNGGNLATTSNLLGFVSTNGQLDGKTPTPKLKGSQHASYGKPAKMVPSDILPSFKDAIAGSTLTKLGLIEVLKQQFPKCPKDAIKNTLESVAVRQGGKDVEKKWILVE
jgi:chromatin assembly factor 1 subunit A